MGKPVSQLRRSITFFDSQYLMSSARLWVLPVHSIVALHPFGFCGIDLKERKETDRDLRANPEPMHACDRYLGRRECESHELSPHLCFAELRHTVKLLPGKEQRHLTSADVRKIFF